MKKRNSLRVPVTAGLKDIYAMDMHAAYQAACLGQFNVLAFGRLAAAISVVRTALVTHQTPIENAVEILDQTIEVLHQVRNHGDATNEWKIAEQDRPTVLMGIEVAEQCIGTLDVALLATTAEKLLQDVSA
ncbi:MAG: hypothetical protein WC742_09395 [Gallionellaceae bacterium]|jgi:hypothetical protein